MRHLHGWIPTKKAYARHVFVSPGSQAFRAHNWTKTSSYVSIAPVLAEEAVKSTTSIEHSKVCVPCFSTLLVRVFRIASTCASWTKPPCDAIGRQRVIVPLKDSPPRCAPPSSQLTILVKNETTETFLVNADFAVIPT